MGVCEHDNITQEYAETSSECESLVFAFHALIAHAKHLLVSLRLSHASIDKVRRRSRATVLVGGLLFVASLHARLLDLWRRHGVVLLPLHRLLRRSQRAEVLDDIGSVLRISQLQVLEAVKHLPILRLLVRAVRVLHEAADFASGGRHVVRRCGGGGLAMLRRRIAERIVVRLDLLRRRLLMISGILRLLKATL